VSGDLTLWVLNTN